MQNTWLSGKVAWDKDARSAILLISLGMWNAVSGEVCTASIHSASGCSNCAAVYLMMR